MNYRDQLIAHLCSYKETVLGIEEQGIYRHRGHNIHCRHILPKAEAWCNILGSFRTQIREYLELRPEIELHRYFHHLNSSQAFALNLFFPYFESESSKSSILLRALGQEGTLQGGKWKLEDVPDRSEESSIDVSWTTSLGIRTLCEVKLTEAGFGSAKHDRRHLDKLHSLYAPRLNGRVEPELLEPEHFFRNYQIMRNVWHLAQSGNSRLIFLLPRANTHSWNSVLALVLRLEADLRDAISIISVESVIRQLCLDGADPDLREYAMCLGEKYLLRQ